MIGLGSPPRAHHHKQFTATRTLAIPSFEAARIAAYNRFRLFREEVMASSPGKTIGAADNTAYDNIQKITAADLVDALSRGIDDFKAKPSHLVILAILYPIAMVVSAN